MVLNKQKQVFGVVEKVEENHDYTGGKTSTAEVTVDNVNREIRVDVNFANMLGETNETAYPGHLGAQTRRIVIKNIEDLENEITRAQTAEAELQDLISDTYDDIELGDSKVKAKLFDETVRAIQAESQLADTIESVVAETAQKFVNVTNSMNELKEFVLDQDDEVLETIQTTEQTLNASIDVVKKDLIKVDKKVDTLSSTTQNSINSLKNTVQQDIQVAINDLQDADKAIVTDVNKSIRNINSEINSVKDTYASKVYVQEQISESQSLSKQLADAVDTEANTVTIKGILRRPVDGVIYLVKDTNSTSNDVYKEYTVIEGELTLIGNTDISLDGYATEDYVNEKIDSIDLSPYATVDQLPTKLSQFQNDANYAKQTDIPDVSEFITAIPPEYVTESELESEHFVKDTTLTSYATKSYVQEELTKVGTVEKRIVDAVDIERNVVIVDGVNILAVPNVIYLVLLPGSSGDYQQYTVINDILTSIGTTNIELTGYASQEYVDKKLSELSEEFTTLLLNIEFIDGGNAPL